MNCENALEYISAALDGELTPEENAQLDQHLAQCDRCRALYDELAALHDACGGLEAAPPPKLKAQIMSNLPAQQKEHKIMFIHWQRWAAAAACVALFALVNWKYPLYDIAFGRSDGVTYGQSAVTADFAPPAPEPAAANDASPASSEPDLDADLPEAAAGGALEAVKSGDTSEARTFHGDTAVVGEDEFDAMAAFAMNGASETAAPAPTPLPDYLNGVPVDVNAAPSVRPDGDTSAYYKMSAKMFDIDKGNGGTENAEEDILPLLAASARMAADSSQETAYADDELSVEGLSAGETHSYFSVLTLQNELVLRDYAPQAQESGEVWYELPDTAFYALVNELTDSGVTFTLRTSGDDISSSAQLGRVIVLP